MSGLPEPLCPWFVKCPKRISVQHYKEYCAKKVERDCLFGYTQCKQFPKNKRKKPQEWAELARKGGVEDG